MAHADLITNKTNIRYLSGFTGSAGFLFITKGKTYLFTDFRYIERARSSVKKGIEVVDSSDKENWHRTLAHHKITILGIEENDLTVERYTRFKKMSRRKGISVKFCDISKKIAQIREIKTPKEIALIKKSQKINEKVFLLIKKIIQSACAENNRKMPTERELAWKIRELGYLHGAEDLAFDPIVAYGVHTAMPHHEPDNTRLKKGDIVMIDMGMKYEGYCSDMTRTFFTSPPGKEEEEIYQLVYRAQHNARMHLKAGMTGEKADALSRDVIEKAGYGAYYGHAGGHGIGLDIHESPALSKNFTSKIASGTIITIEPGIYLPGKYGVRIEDMGRVTAQGFQNFTTISKKVN